jgi:diguanylate cyclase (GGDEF)-like protein
MRVHDPSRAQPNGQAPTTLLATLRYAHVRLAAIMLLAVGLSLTVIALMALRTYAEHNLHLVARSIAYTAEAAVVFRDNEASAESLSLIARQESLASATIVDASGSVLGQFARPNNTALDLLGDHLADLLLTQPTTAPIVFQGKPIGQVRLRGDGAAFVRFIFAGLLGLLGCLALGAVSVWRLSRKSYREILQPVRELTTMTRAARAEPNTSRRAPRSHIAEFDQLGEDFNALLGEIEAQQAQLHQENKSLSHLANHDSLTGLPNRAYFRRRLSRVLQDAQTQGTSIGVLYLDNDHFKSVNDKYGHATGDALLIEVAQRIRAQLREGDVVARLGGDEFAVLLAPLHSSDDASRIADKILASMATPMATRFADRIVPSVSIGIAIYPLHGNSSEQLLRAADRAMYQVKSEQRGHKHMFNFEDDAKDMKETH